MDLIPAALDMSSCAHTSPKMGLTPHLSEADKEEVIDEVLAEFTRHNRRSFRRDLLMRPLCYLHAARDAGLLRSRRALIRQIRDLLPI